MPHGCGVVSSRHRCDSSTCARPANGAADTCWQDLFADLQTLKFKSKDEIRALLARAGVGPSQEAVTYCAVGMRASLMYWAAQAVGMPARVYAGSWQDWRRDSTNPIAR